MEIKNLTKTLTYCKSGERTISISKLRLIVSMPTAEYAKAAVRSYLFTLWYTSIVNNGGNSPRFQKEVIMNLREYLENQCISSSVILNLDEEGIGSRKETM